MRKYSTKAWGLFAVFASLASFNFGCKFGFNTSSSKSKTKSEQAENSVPQGSLKNLSGAISIPYKTSTGSMFPVHYNIQILVDENQKSATFSSQVVSDGGFEKSVSGAKVKPDESLKLKSSAALSQDSVSSAQQDLLQFEYTNSKGKVLSIQLSQTKIGWQLYKVNYFGTESFVDGSWATSLW